MVSKEQLKSIFDKEWEKHYKIETLVDKGFERKKCKNCGSNFWTIDSSREICADSTCIGYQFIGKKTTNLDYAQAWKEIEKFFSKHGHTPIKRFPTVCRWRDDLYFTNASIIDFQPFVVTGEVEPPANPLVVPQACIRFNDIGNVGVTGRHYTSFIMFGQHAFNTKKTGLFYWKNQAIEYEYEFITKILGAKKEDICFQEQVWQGGGNFGPCMEYTALGLELGNCVFMQFKEMPDGSYKELDTKVIDHGAGLERFAWFTKGTPTSYEVVFESILPKLKKQAGVELETKLFSNYAKLSGLLDVESQKNKQTRMEIAKKLGVGEKELFEELNKLQSLYAALDHLKTILYTTTDGMLPSNSGGGYNLRMLLRRVFAFEEEFKWQFDCPKIIQGIAEIIAGFDDSLLNGVETTIDLLGAERKKFLETRETGKKKLVFVVERLKKENKKLEEKEMLKLYESDGIPLELMKEICEKEKIKAEFPDDFYNKIAKKNEKTKEQEKTILDTKDSPKTKLLFYEDQYMKEFEAKIIQIKDDYIILDKTLFYPEGGGQINDTGEINNIQVVSVQKQNNIVLHKLADAKKLKAGQMVFGKINWERRKNLMQHHTATHLLNASARELLGQHIWQAGAEKTEHKAHLDITHYKKISPEQLIELEALVNKRIQENIDVKTELLERNKAEEKYGFRIYQGGFVPGKELRIVNVRGIDIEACAGTHVKRTGDIGFFKIMKREGIQDGIERITFVSGNAAIRFMQEKEKLLKSIAEKMNVQEENLEKAIEKIVLEAKEQRKTTEKESKQQATILLEELLTTKEDTVKKFIQNASGETLLELSKKFLEKKPEKTIILATQEEILIATGHKSNKNAAELLQKMLANLKGKGGGSKQMARARISEESAKKIEEEMRKIK